MISLWWLIDDCEISPSIIHLESWNFIFKSLIAEWQLFPPRKLGSKMLSRIIFITSCTILSLGGAIVRGLVPSPLALGIFILLPGENWKELSFILSIMLSEGGGCDSGCHISGLTFKFIVRYLVNISIIHNIINFIYYKIWVLATEFRNLP